MARKRTFSTKVEDKEPIEVEFDGLRLSNDEPWAETFRCVPMAPAGAIDDFVAAVRVDERGNQSWSAPSLQRFFRTILLDGEHDRFNDLVHDPDRVVTLDTLGEAVTWLAEQYTGRPTSPPST